MDLALLSDLSIVLLEVKVIPQRLCQGVLRRNSCPVTSRVASEIK
jgi:hypothetical protein